ncbi:cilia- and flagella-associated protein 298-A-like [Ipomoea triloba]|uniref:cilia- and flagella-associated protein 298-A-like n=1 Tax=Ipomoea triloba TaxID=35885 RepID=UPI00125DCD61|nr:cilia- and flagella-associated protein 298-A-like [Ipomoea triloba]
MVRIQVKHGGGSEFLYDTESTSSVEEIAKDVTEIANLQSKIERLSLQLEPHLSPLLHSDSKVMALARALSEARSYASKNQVIHNKPLSIYVLRDHIRSVENAFAEAYSLFGFSNGSLQNLFPDLELIQERTIQLWWAGKELEKGKKLCDYIGKNEKTKVVIRLQSPMISPASITGGESSCK